MKKILLLTISIVFFSTLLFAQELLSPTAKRIVRQTMAFNGVLTKEMHQKFWKEVNKLGNPTEIEQVITSLKILLLTAQEYQKEVWESAKISHSYNKVFQTQRLIELEAEMPIEFEQSLKFPKGSANYNIAISSYEEKLKNSMMNAKHILETASQHKALSARGQRIMLDDQKISAILNNLSSVFIRLEKLLHKQWE